MEDAGDHRRSRHSEGDRSSICGKGAGGLGAIDLSHDSRAVSAAACDRRNFFHPRLHHRSLGAAHTAGAAASRTRSCDIRFGAAWTGAWRGRGDAGNRHADQPPWQRAADPRYRNRV